MTNTTLAERETIARFSDEPGDVLVLETFNKKHALRLIRDGATVRRTQERGGAVYWTLEMPKKWFKWPKAPRVVSDEQREALRKRAGSLKRPTKNAVPST